MGPLDISAVNDSMLNSSNLTNVTSVTNMTNMEDERRKDPVLVSLDVDFLERFAHFEHDLEVVKLGLSDSSKDVKGLEGGLTEAVVRAKDFGTKMMKFIQEQEAWNREQQQALNACNLQVMALGSKMGIPDDFVESFSRQLRQGLMSEVTLLQRENSMLRERLEHMERAMESERERGRKQFLDLQRRVEELDREAPRGPMGWEIKGLSPLKASYSPVKASPAPPKTPATDAKPTPDCKVKPGGRGRGRPMASMAPNLVGKSGLASRLPARPHSALGRSAAAPVTTTRKSVTNKENVKPGLTPKAARKKQVEKSDKERAVPRPVVKNPKKV